LKKIYHLADANYNEVLGPVKDEEFLDQLNDCYLIKKGCAACG
jgi:hypothetical protein